MMQITPKGGLLLTDALGNLDLARCMNGYRGAITSTSVALTLYLLVWSD